MRKSPPYSRRPEAFSLFRSVWDRLRKRDEVRNSSDVSFSAEDSQNRRTDFPEIRIPSPASAVFFLLFSGLLSPHRQNPENRFCLSRNPFFFRSGPFRENGSLPVLGCASFGEKSSGIWIPALLPSEDFSDAPEKFCEKFTKKT